MPSTQAATRYVNLNAAGGNNGTSWAHAYTNLQSAITAASAGDDIHVAQGSYYPTTDETGSASPTDPRTKTFFINKNIALYGGYNLNRNTPIRDIDQFPTILSGNIGVTTNHIDNTYQVLVFEQVSNSCRLDGFHVRDGRAFGPELADRDGPGAYLRATTWQTSPTIINCRFTNNQGDRGGAITLDIFDNDDDTKIINTLFFDNRSKFSGALYSTIRGIGTQNLEIRNCAMTQNSSSRGSAAMYIQPIATLQAISNIEITNCTIAGNTGGLASPVQMPISEDDGNSLVSIFARNSIFNNPDAGNGQPEIGTAVGFSTSIDIDNCFLHESGCAAITKPGNTITCGTNMFYNIDPQLTDIENGNLRPVTGSPVIDAGTAIDAPTDDILGQARPLLSSFDIGAYEFPGLQPSFLNLRLDPNNQPVLNWTCLTGEQYTIRRATDDLGNFTILQTGYPASGTEEWNEVFTDTSATSLPRAFYQVERE